MLRSRGSAAIGAMVGATLLVMLPFAGCSLVLDFSDPPAPPDAMVADAIPAAACDFQENNGTRAEAMPLAPITGQSAGICVAGDHDFYAITVVDGQQLTFEILFDQEGARGDLDMFLRASDEQVVARSLSTNSDESIACPGAIGCVDGLAAGNYFIEVFGFADSTINGYTINYTLTGP